MVTNARLAFFVCVGLSGIASAQSTATGPTYGVDFVVHTTSFVTQLSWAPPGPPVHIARSISYGANHWAAYAGARHKYRYAGETALDECTWGGPIVISARPGCAPGDSSCVKLALNQYWCGMINFFRGKDDRPFVWTTNLPEFDQYNLAGAAAHEFGHSVIQGTGNGAGHLVKPGVIPGDDPDWCTLGPVVSGEKPSGFCAAEVRTVARQAFNLGGYGYLNSFLAEGTANGPNPTSFSAPITTALPTGIGGGELFVGRDYGAPYTEHKFTATTKALVPVANLHPVDLAPSNGSFHVEIGSSVARPTVLWDPMRNAWWVFMRTEADGNRVRVWKGIPGVSGFVDNGLITFPPYLEIQSKFPVAIARHPSRSDQLILVWNSSEGRGAFNTRCDLLPVGAGASWMKHCRGEILAATLQVNSSGVGLTVQSVQRFTNSGASVDKFGYAGNGAPVVVCDDEYWHNYNCEIFIVNTSQWMEIQSWKVRLDYNGFVSYTARSSERTNTPGETDFPIGISPRNWDWSGRHLEAVTGGDFKVYFRSRADVSQTFPSWSAPYGAGAMSGPTVKRSLGQDVYTMTYAKE